jgi:hypothetical protein
MFQQKRSNLLPEENKEKARYLRSQIHYFEVLASHNHDEGNGEQWQYCVNQRAKLVLQLQKFEQSLATKN